MDAALDIKQGHVIRIVCVDDEPSILNALQRSLFDLNCQIRTAEDAQAALNMLETEPAEIVISDMRMPGMDGAAFLTEVASRWPETERILLTGFSDMESTIAAINNGKISCYLDKPWDDERLREIINKTIDLAEIKYRNAELENQIIAQNEQLKNWNEKLEKLVSERTAELEESNKKLNASNNELHEHYQTTVQLFSSLIEQRLGNQQTSNRTVIWVIKRLVKELNLSPEEQSALIYASVLRNIGKIGLPDEIIKAPYLSLNPKQQREFHRHTIIAETLLSSIPPLTQAAKILSQRDEHEDGSGHPNGLQRSEIGLPAAVLGLISDYFAYCNGQIDEQPCTPSQAISRIQELSDQHYRVEVVAAFEKIWPELSAQHQIRSEDNVSSIKLKPGMILSRDLITTSGTLLLAEGQMLDKALIEHLQKLEHEFQEVLKIYVQEVNSG